MTSLTIGTQRATRKQHIKFYASTCIHNNVAKPYDEFKFKEKIHFTIFS